MFIIPPIISGRVPPFLVKKRSFSKNSNFQTFFFWNPRDEEIFLTHTLKFSGRGGGPGGEEGASTMFAASHV